MAETIGNAYLNVIPQMQSGSMDTLMDDATGGLAAKAGSAGEVAGAGLLAGMKGPLIGAGAALAGAMGLKKLADGLMDIGNTFDTMADTIVVGTGASGAALEALKDSASAIATTVPTSFEAAGDIVQDLNTRMGLVGTDLENVGQRVAAAGELLGESLDLNKLTGSFNAFGVAGEDAAAKMDYLFNVGQATGIGFNELTGIIERNAPALQNLGFSFEESANMAGLLDKAGMDAGGTMGKMAKALTELAEPGQSAADAYQEVITKMEGFIAAGDTASAIDVASNVFGTRGAAQFVGAIQSGAMSMEELRNASLGAGDGIMGTMDATMDWPERFELLKNRAMEFLEPIGGAMMEGANRAFEKFDELLGSIDGAPFDSVTDGITALIDSGADAIVDGIQWFIDNKDAVSGGINAIGNAIAAVKTVLDPIVGVITTIVSTIASTVMPVIQNVASFIAENIIPTVQDIANEVAPIVKEIGSVVGEVFSSIQGIIGDVMGAIGGVIAEVWPGIASTIKTVVGVIGNVIKTAFPVIKNVITTVMGAVRSVIATVWPAIKGIVTGAVNAITGVIKGISNVVSAVTNTFNNIKEAITGPINKAKEVVKNIIDTIAGFFKNVKFELPKIKLPRFSIKPPGWKIGDLLKGKIPSLGIEWYAKGGIAGMDGADIIGVGERGPEMVWPSYEPYLSKYADALAARMGGHGGGNVVINLNYQAGDDATQMVRDIARGVQRYKMAGAF